MKAKIIEMIKKTPTFKEIPIGGLFCDRLTRSPYMKIEENNCKNAVNLEYGYITTFEQDAEVIRVLDYRFEVQI